MINRYTRSDLAVERRGTGTASLCGTEYSEKRIGENIVSELKILTLEASEKIGKPIGRYVTVSCERLWLADGEEKKSICAIISVEIRNMVKQMLGIDEADLSENFGVLVAGLGNDKITPDAIGPLTVDKLTVTRHLREHEPKIYKSLHSCSISAISPGVLGKTGIETVELIRGAAENARPNIVVAVDSLVARSCKRLATTVQLANTGIAPGSGIGNDRKAISIETIGVPVLSIGVPTVVDSSTLVYDAIKEAGINPDLKSLRNVIENGRGFFVSPKDSDIIVQKTSDILADAIGVAFSFY